MSIPLYGLFRQFRTSCIFSPPPGYHLIDSASMAFSKCIYHFDNFRFKNNSNRKQHSKPKIVLIMTSREYRIFQCAYK